MKTFAEPGVVVRPRGTSAVSIVAVGAWVGCGLTAIDARAHRSTFEIPTPGEPPC